MATRSPFPGMDPYLERHWGDVHHALITYARDALNECLPADLRARMEERVYLETGDQIRRRVRDVRILEQPRATGTQARSNGGAIVAEPLVIALPDDPVTETFIQILDSRTGNRVVTVIEILSPGNKSGGIGQRMYVQNQEEIYASRASLVEIDLLREGNRVILCPPENIPPSPRTPYQICVHRGW